MVKIGLDVDGVLAIWPQAIIDKAATMGLAEHFPKNWRECHQWFFSDRIGDVWKVIHDDEAFWLSIPYFIDAKTTLFFEPHCYVTARSVRSEVTEEWLRRNGFPAAPVYTVGPTESKLPILTELGVDLFVDDKPETYDELNEAGLTTLLYDRPWNRRIRRRFPVIESFTEVCRYV